MVDITRPSMSGVSFKDYYKRPQCVHLGVEVVLLDKTTSPLTPTLYQLNNTASSSERNELFTQLGEVVALDTQKKLVTLANDNIVTYQHLIIASGPKSSWMSPMPDQEFAAGIQVLMEALRMQESKPTAPPCASTNKIRNSKHGEDATIAISMPMPPEKTEAPVKDPKRIYQVQL